MSRIYDDQPLTNLPLINIEYSGKWNANDFMQGNGVIFEGVVQKRAHFAINDQQHKKEQYYILYVKISRAHRRKFDASGEEIEPNFSETKKVNTGYLNSSYKVQSKGETDRLGTDEARKLISPANLTQFSDRHGGSDLAALWLTETQATGTEFELGDTLRVKTQGDGPFVFSITKLDAVSTTVGNYAGGESVGASWTDKIMDIKSHAAASENQGADDNEWDD
ncbi:arpin-like [Dreissena polymorpha]|nr:arpin-like [Dreissena polymorpha]